MVSTHEGRPVDRASGRRRARRVQGFTVKIATHTVVFVVAALLALTACDPVVRETTGTDRGASTDAAGDPSRGIPEVVGEVEPAVVSVFPEGGIGSGVIVGDGLIVTNAHVVGNLSEVGVQLATGVRLIADVMAVDPQTDIAVLDTGREDLPAARFAEGLPRVGELAIAIGSPLGLENTVTAGIISGLNRAVPAGPTTPQALVDLIQTDAPIAPGNSGGALVNADAEVVGINVAYAPPTQTGATAIGFAIPAPTVVDVVEQLVETGEVRHAFMGVQPGPLTPQMIEQFGLDVEEGVVLIDVVPNGPAANAGLEPGDVVVGMDGEPVRAVPELLGELRRRDPGDTVEVTVVRGEEQLEIPVELADQPESL
jgi:serine protease DegQ